MGGLLRLAREAATKSRDVTQAYLPASDQLRALGIELIEGYQQRTAAIAPRYVCDRQCGQSRALHLMVTQVPLMRPF